MFTNVSKVPGKIRISSDFARTWRYQIRKERDMAVRELEKECPELVDLAKEDAQTMLKFQSALLKGCWRTEAVRMYWAMDTACREKMEDCVLSIMHGQNAIKCTGL